MKIGIDVDGCIYPWITAVNDAVAERYGIEGLTDHPYWMYLKDQLTNEQWEWVWSSEGAEPVFGRMDLIYDEAAEAINALCNEHEVHFVTHRHPRRLTEITGRWLNKYFRNYAGVHTLHNICKKHTLGQWDVFIDDKPSTVLEFLNCTDATVLVPDRPWNAIDVHCAPSTSYNRFSNWNEVPYLVEAARD